MIGLRPLFGLVLALCLALTSGAMAVARGQAPAVGQIVLCTGLGVVSVGIDAEGNPTGPAHICPYCVLAAFAVVEPSPAGPARPLTWRAARWPDPGPPPAVSRRALPPAARAPPISV
jgi:hypothetical protein